MTEKEKIRRGLLYDANNDKELIHERLTAKELCCDFNNLRPSDEAAQEKLLRKLLGSAGENFTVLAPFWCDYGYNIHIGEN